MLRSVRSGGPLLNGGSSLYPDGGAIDRGGVIGAADHASSASDTRRCSTSVLAELAPQTLPLADS